MFTSRAGTRGRWLRPSLPARGAAVAVLAGSLVAPPVQAPAAWAESTAAAEAAAAEASYDVLVFSKTAGFRHDSIDEGIAAIQKLGREHGFSVVATEDAGQFTDANLATFEAVVWLSTTGDVLDDAQQGAFERYIQAGGGYVGVHAASDTEYTWPWYGHLVGAYFKSHPAGTPTATVTVENKATPSSCFLPTDWERTDEWYNFQSPIDPVVGGWGGDDYSPRSDVTVIATVDESTYEEGDDNATDDDHPIAWYQDYDGGRSFYTGGGHTAASFTEPLFTTHLLGGIQYAAGQAPDACAALPPDDSDFEQVTLAKGVDKVGEPMSLSVLPDGRVLHNARDGRIFLTDLAGSTELLGTVPVYMHDEDGLQSLAVAPDFATSGWVYLYYAPPLSTPAGDAPNNGTAADFEPFEGYNVLSRVKMVDDQLDLATEQELLRVEADRGICCHAGGAIDFDAAGNLYLSTGDDTNPFASDGYNPIDERSTRNPAYDAQRSAANTNDLRGKVLRITPDPAAASYTIPPSNLFPEADDTSGRTRPEIYAMGFRNPFRMTVDKQTGYVYVGEYGPDAGSANPDRGPGGLVEFDQVRAAGNFGWPYCTGPNTAETTYNDRDFATGTSGPKFDCASPVNDSPNNTGLTNLPPAQPAWIHYDGGSVTYGGATTGEFGTGGEGPMAGPVYDFDPDLASDTKFPEYFDNHFFAGEWTRGWIKDIGIDAAGDVAGINPFFDSSTLYAAMDMEFGPDGSLYVLDYGNGGYFTGNENSAVYKINHIRAGFRSPVAVAAATPDSGPVPLPVDFSSAGSADPDEGDSIASYAWDFDSDGTVDSTDANPRHTYQQAGAYDARLTVTDTTGRTGTSTVVVTVGNTRPTVDVELPPDGGLFEFGDSVRVKVAVTDPEDGEIDCSLVQIDYILGHDSHGHPLTTATGCDVTLPTVQDEGHDASANVFGVINVRYTDHGGVEGVGPLTGEAEIVLQPKRKEAEHFTSQSGVQASEVVSDPLGGGRNVSHADDGDWIAFTPMSLLNIHELRLRVASASGGGTIEARYDSPAGELVGTVDVPGTGGWQSWQTVTMPVDAAADRGTHELFLVFRNPTNPTGLFNLNFIDFAGRGVSLNSRPEVGVQATPTQGEAPLPVSFTGSATDFDGDELTYRWDFGVAGTDEDTAATLDATWTYEQPGTYTARLTATDPKGASDSSTVAVRVLPVCTGVPIATDEFDGDALDLCRWNAIVREDPTRHRLAGGELTLTTTGGDIWLGADPSSTTNLVLQSADRAPGEDYVMETRMSASFTDGYAQGGLLVYGDDDNYVKLDVISDSGQGRINRVELRSEVGGAVAGPELNVDAPANVSSYRLRLTKSGTDYTGEVAFDGGDWIPVATVPNPTVQMGFGVFAFGGGQPGRTATFDHVRVELPNRPPVADDDSAVTGMDSPVDVDVLEGDTDPDGDQLVVTEVGGPTHGTATLNDDGTVRYTPVAGFQGQDTFGYTVSDGRGGTASGMVTVTVDGSGPVVEGLSPLGTTRDRTPDVVARVADGGSGVDRSGITLLVDGKVVTSFEYDAEEERLRYVPQDALSPGRHVVRIVAEDRAGNRTTTTWRFQVRR